MYEAGEGREGLDQRDEIMLRNKGEERGEARGMKMGIQKGMKQERENTLKLVPKCQRMGTQSISQG